MKQQSITSLPLSPEADRRNRMIKYSITMGIRVVCIVMMLFVQGWWLLVFALGAILLPYIAVVIANVHGDPRGASVYRPGAIELVRREGVPAAPGDAPDVDAPDVDARDDAPDVDAPDVPAPDVPAPDVPAPGPAGDTHGTAGPARGDKRDADGSAA